MSADRDRKRVHFLGPKDLIERVDALAEAMDHNRTDVITEALREYVDETTNHGRVRQRLAFEFYEDEISFETLASLVGFEEAARIRLLKHDLDAEPLDVPAPDRDADIYDETRTRTANE